MSVKWAWPNKDGETLPCRKINVNQFNYVV